MKQLILFLTMLTFSGLLYGQSVSLSETGANPDSSAMLDVQSTTRGMLIPRMSTAQRIAINNPATGLLVYDNTTNTFWFHDGSIWEELVGGATVGDELRDADNNTKVQVEESTNEDIIRFDVAGTERMTLDSSAFRLEETGFSLKGTYDANFTGPLPDNGAGTRMMWVPQIGSFYMGTWDSPSWPGNTGIFSTVAGGKNNDALGDYNFIGGGDRNQIFEDYNSIVGGEGNLLLGWDHSFIGGGRLNEIDFTSGAFHSIVGGERNRIIGLDFGNSHSFIGGGKGNLLEGFYSAILGGSGNSITSPFYSSIGGGYANHVYESRSFIGGGGNNIIGDIISQGQTSQGRNNFIGGGGSNEILYESASFIGGGNGNQIGESPDFPWLATTEGNNNFIGGGTSNSILNTNHSNITGGQNNLITGAYSNILGGRANHAPSYGETVAGYYSTEYSPISDSTPANLDRLFTIGNGVDSSNRSNAFTLLKNGNLGLGEDAPLAKLHVKDGMVFLGGTYDPSFAGPLPASGPGTRLMWIPEKAAFRAGSVNLNQWDLSLMGNHSFVAGGEGGVALGNSSFTGGGVLANAFGKWSFVGGGYENAASGSGSVILGGISNVTDASASYAFVGGGNTNTASASSSFVAGGSGNEATGVGAFVSGSNNWASGGSSFIAGGSNNSTLAPGSFTGGGNNNTAEGSNSFVGGGENNTAWSHGEAVFGLNATDYTPSFSAFSPNDRLFVVGNGSSQSSPSNALTLLKNGNLGLGDDTPTAKLQVSEGQVLFDGSFDDTFSGPIPVSGAGARLMWIPERAAFRVGLVDSIQWDLDSIGKYSSVAGGFNNTASGFNSFVGGGFQNSTRGTRSSVIGGFGNTTEAAECVVAGGVLNTASGASSFVGGGVNNTASGAFSYVGAGLGNTAPSYGETVFGLYSLNYAPNNATSYDSLDRIFVIGNGAGSANRSNAMTILKNGKVGLGTVAPGYTLDVVGDINASGAVHANGLALASDIRYKRNIQPLNSSLQILAQIRGVSYEWRDSYRETGLQYGFIAQELEEILPDMVQTDESGYKSVEYVEMIPILLEGMKEQQEMIRTLKEENQSLKAQNQAILERLAKIEAKLND